MQLSFVVSFLLPSLFILFLSTPTRSDDASAMIEMMADMGLAIPVDCYTPPNLEDIFMRACGKVLNNSSQCSSVWKVFTSAFGFKDPNNVTGEDYKAYFDALQIVTPPNTVVFWSSTRKVVENISGHPNISSSANQVSSKIINTMFSDDNVMCWCGNETALLDPVNPCPMTPGPTTVFWQKFSCLLAESASGVAFWAGYGDKKGGAYQNLSFFAEYEFPKLTPDKVNRLVVINMKDCNISTGEKCGEGTLITLQNQAVEKYGNGMGYQCYEVCGNPLDEQQISSLANHTVEIIRKEQAATGSAVRLSSSLLVHFLCLCFILYLAA